MRSRTITGRAGWGLADQAFSSLTNFALSAVVARNTSASGFGAFALIFSTYLLLLGVARSVTTLPIMVRFSSVDDADWREATSSATGTAFAIGLASGVVCAAAAAVSGAPTGPLMALAICLPGLLVQEAWRHAFIAKGSPSLAFVNDVVWAVALVPAMLAAIAVDDGPAPFVLAWGLSGTVAAAVGIAQARIVPNARATLGWTRSHRDLSVRAVGEFLANTGSTQLVIYAAGFVAGLAAAGALRGAQVLLGPLNTAFQGIWIVGLAEFVRILKRRPALFTKAAVGMSLMLGVGAIVYAGLLLTFGDTLGPIVLGETWAQTEPVLLPMSLAAAAWGLWLGATVGLRALQEFGRSLRARVIVSALNVIGGVTGAVLGGARGAAWGLGLTYLVGVGIWWREFFRARSRPSGGASDATPDIVDRQVEGIVDRQAEGIV